MFIFKFNRLFNAKATRNLGGLRPSLRCFLADRLRLAPAWAFRPSAEL